MSTAGTFGGQRLQHQDQRDPGDPDHSRGGHRLAVGQPFDEAGELPDQALGADLEPEQLRQLPDQDGQRQAVHVADHGRLGDQVGDEPELRHRRHDHDGRDHEREDRGQRDRPLGVAVSAGQRQDRRGDHRSQRGIRAQHEDPGRAEHRVAEQAHDRGVQAGDGRQACQFRVGHALRDQQRGEHYPGNDVLGQPRTPVRPSLLQPGSQLNTDITPRP